MISTKKIDKSKRRTIDFLVDVNPTLYKDIRYLIRYGARVQNPEQTLTLKSGSCRDSGWLPVQLLRHLAWRRALCRATWIQLTPDVMAIGTHPRPSADFTGPARLVARCIYRAVLAGLAFDPTSACSRAKASRIPLACTPQPSSAAPPIEGGVDKAEVEFSHHMAVTRDL